MNDELNHELRARFQHQRASEHVHAPAWIPSRLHQPQPQRASSASTLRWALATVLTFCGAIWLLHEPRQDLAALPPWFESPPGELFAGLAEPSTDFLLPAHLTIPMP